MNWLILIILPIVVGGFQTPSKDRLTKGVGLHRTRQLFLSDIPQNNDDSSKEGRNKAKASNNKEWLEKHLPPPPEDVFTLSGDLVALTVYGFVDHLISNDLSSFIVHRATTIPRLERLLPDTWRVPVWIDGQHQQAMMQHAVHDRWIVHYTGPLLYTGSAVVLLASCWLLAGYLLQSFSWRNTLQCRTDHALVVTAATWVLSTSIAATIVAMSSTVITNGDMLFLVDSLSVLTMWRFMANALFGSGRD